MILKTLINKTLFLKPLYFLHIKSQNTPNPNFLKFVPVGHQILGDDGTMDISSSQYADASPLAQQLFGISGVTRVFYGSDYVSIAKSQQTQWQQIKPQIQSTLSQYLESKLPILAANVSAESDQSDPNDSETVQFIKEIMYTRIRPTVQEDGGDVRFVSFNEESGALTLKLVGACSGCPSSSVTLKQGIEKMLTYYVKEIKEVKSEDE